MIAQQILTPLRTKLDRAGIETITAKDSLFLGFEINSLLYHAFVERGRRGGRAMTKKEQRLCDLQYLESRTHFF